MVRPLLEIEQPYLTRDQLEAAIWRLTGTRNRAAIEQLLRLADVYAVSQGPALIDALHERDRSRERWKIQLPGYAVPADPVPGTTALTGLRKLRLAEASPPDVGDHVSVLDASDGEAAASSFDFSAEQLHPDKPAKAAQVWKLPDGRMFQWCSGCASPKDYNDFYKDSNRWNRRASQCKTCKNGNRKASLASHAP